MRTFYFIDSFDDYQNLLQTIVLVYWSLEDNTKIISEIKTNCKEIFCNFKMSLNEKHIGGLLRRYQILRIHLLDHDKQVSFQ